MIIADLRDDLEELRSYVKHGHGDKALEKINQTLRELDGGRLLTTTEAATFLGIRSVNTLKLLVRAEQLRTVHRGNRLMIPLEEIERVLDSDRVRNLQHTDLVHNVTEELGITAGLNAEELDMLEQSRPGVLPWRRRYSDDTERPDGKAE